MDSPAPRPTDRATAASPASAWRGAAATLAKAAVAAGVLVLVLRSVDTADLGRRLGRLGAGDVGWLALLAGAQVTFGAVRWHRLLQRLGERISFRRVYAEMLVGCTFNMFLPTGLGGDVVRALRMRGRCASPAHAWSSSIYERIAGLVALVTTGAAGAVLGLGNRPDVPRSVHSVAVGLAVAVVLVFFLGSTPVRVAVTLLERRLPSVALTDMRGILRDLEGVLASRGARLETLAWSVAGQLTGIAFLAYGARALGAPGHALAIIVGVPIVFVLSMVPITLGGHGLREGLYVGVLGALGVPTDVALGLAALFLASCVASALGGIVVLAAEAASGRRQNAGDQTENLLREGQRAREAGRLDADKIDKSG